MVIMMHIFFQKVPYTTSIPLIPDNSLLPPVVSVSLFPMQKIKAMYTII